MIRYIRRIESCPARHLASALPLPDTLSVLLPLSVVWDPLEIIDLASLTVSDASTSGLRLWTAKLSATLATRSAPHYLSKLALVLACSCFFLFIIYKRRRS